MICITRMLINGLEWVQSLSDFTGRPVVLQMCEPIIAADILDLGCGEGYFSRLLLTKDRDQSLE